MGYFRHCFQHCRHGNIKTKQINGHIFLLACKHVSDDPNCNYHTVTERLALLLHSKNVVGSIPRYRVRPLHVCVGLYYI